jgi:hypothetical protein
MTVRLAADPVLLGPYHARAELVQDSEGGFVPCQPKLLELNRRHACVWLATR